MGRACGFRRPPSPLFSTKERPGRRPDSLSFEGKGKAALSLTLDSKECGPAPRLLFLCKGREGAQAALPLHLKKQAAATAPPTCL